MEIEGTYTLQASPEEVWNSLMDQRTLEHAIPGIKRLEAHGDHTSSFEILVKQTPLKGQYTGLVRVIEQEYPSVYRFTIEGEDQQSKIRGEWTVNLSELNENTVVAYKGTLHFGKTSALLPMPMIRGTIKVLIQQFFTLLADQLRTTHRTYGEMAEITGEMVVVEDVQNQDAIVLAAAHWPALLHIVVQQLGLGKGDPLLQEQWVTRLRRTSMFTALLLLVWIGTRLPGRLFTHD
ncbi:MAG TPA: SRPBCC domain-containing protein [Ktedonobacteraceae bacterium]